MSNIEELLGLVDDLPALPDASARLIALVLDTDCDLREVEEVVRHDEAITMTVLRYANSVRYGTPGRVFSLRESITRLGVRMMLKIGLMQQTSSIFVSAGRSYGLRRGAMWRGALGGAIAAELIGVDQRYEETDLCFVCALLRDIGKLVLDVVCAGNEIMMAGARVKPEHSFLQAERALFGTDHAELGAALARRWALPERIAHAIEYHHAPPGEDPDHDTLFDIVHAADTVCLWAGIGVGFDGLQYPLAPHVRDGILPGRAEAEVYIASTWRQLLEFDEEMGELPDREKSA